jgi:hypothetical protein
MREIRSYGSVGEWGGNALLYPDNAKWNMFRGNKIKIEENSKK